MTFEQYVLNLYFELSQSFIEFHSISEYVLRSEGHGYLTGFGIAKMPAMSTLATFAQMVLSGWAAPEFDDQTRSKQ